jgi:hypothetical protein
MTRIDRIKLIASTSLFVCVLVISSSAAAQQSSELDTVKAADQAFYAAFSARDIDKAGTGSSGSNLETNIFQKQDGRWLMVHHHASLMPQWERHRSPMRAIPAICNYHALSERQAIAREQLPGHDRPRTNRNSAKGCLLIHGQFA